jgi:hypothetical protein
MSSFSRIQLLDGTKYRYRYDIALQQYSKSLFIFHSHRLEMTLFCLFNEPLPPTLCLEVGDFSVDMLN